MTRSFTWRDDAGLDLTVSETHDLSHVVISIEDDCNDKYSVALTPEQWEQLTNLKWEIKFAGTPIAELIPAPPPEQAVEDISVEPLPLTEEAMF